MRPFLFLAATGMSTIGNLGATEPQHIASGPARVALLELFTSEGCSSCPPAEKWLGALRNDPGLWRDFVPVAWHVTYWDRLGWPDRFASREATQRQHDFAAAWDARSVYTPCFVRDGAEWRVRGGKIAAAGGAAAGMLRASYDGAIVRAEFVPAETAARGAGAREFEIHAALLGGGIVSKVTAGENRGETLAHEFVALAQARGAPGEPIALPRKKIAGVTRHALAVWVTRRGDLAPLQAAGGWLRTGD